MLQETELGEKSRRGADRAAAERVLLVAVLDDAIGCFRKHLFSVDAEEQRLFHETEGWIMGECPSDQATPNDCFTFVYVCQALGFDARVLREQLRRWRESQIEARMRRLGLEPADDG